MNDFKLDLNWSLDYAENEMFDNFYKRNLIEVEDIEFCNDMERQKKGIDKIIHFKNGNTISIDEKKRRENFGDILLELWSNFEKRKYGWLFTCQCDYIAYAIMPTKMIYLLPSQLLKKAWETNRSKWLFTKPIIAKNTGYTTVSRAIKTQELLSAIALEMIQKF